MNHKFLRFIREGLSKIIQKHKGTIIKSEFGVKREA